MSSYRFPVVSGESSGLSRYLAEIQAYPILEATEEYTLAKRWIDHQDVNAAHRLVTSHLRLVVRIAKEYRGYHLPIGEMIAEGTIGLMQAVKKFDPDKGFRLATYAIWWIRASIQEYVLRSWSIVRVGTTAAQKKLFFNLRKIKSHIQAMSDGDMRDEHVDYIADVLNVPSNDVVEMNRRMVGYDASLNTPMGFSSGEDDTQWQDWVADERPDQEVVFLENQEKNYRHTLLMQALHSLTDREREILVARRLQENPETLEVLSERYDISRERVRQIEVRAFEKLQTLVKRKVDVTDVEVL